jgi:hypothetical protein
MRDLLPGVVTIRYRARLGNRLAQYCLARRIATELDFHLHCPKIEGFPGTGPLGLGLRRHLPFQNRQVVSTHHELDLQDVVGDRRARIVDLRGLFIRYEYFQPYKQQIRDSWLLSGGLPRLGGDRLTIHIRSGDVWDQGPQAARTNGEYFTLPFSFYARIIEQERWPGVDLVTEDPADPMVRKLAASFGARVISGPAISDFNWIRASRHIVLSVSTFAWWAAWLSRAERIYYPVLGLLDSERARRRPYPWRQDLQVWDEPRYVYLKVDAPDPTWTGSEANRQRLLNS